MESWLSVKQRWMWVVQGPLMQSTALVVLGSLSFELFEESPWMRRLARQSTLSVADSINDAEVRQNTLTLRRRLRPFIKSDRQARFVVKFNLHLSLPADIWRATSHHSDGVSNLPPGRLEPLACFGASEDDVPHYCLFQLTPQNRDLNSLMSTISELEDLVRWVLGSPLKLPPARCTGDADRTLRAAPATDVGDSRL